MKDNMKSCQHTLSNDIEYKEVVIIGNGPSGMVTSFMLAGNVPHLKPVPEDLPIDDMLRARLSNIPEGKSLYEVDLSELAEGLEGRSHNPIPILMDCLLRPCTDMGIEADALIEWKHDVDKQIDHVVLGRHGVGGAWSRVPSRVRTLSPAAWLALPPHAATGKGRLRARAVAAYCRRYVKAMGLTRYFRNGVVVSSVTRAPRLPAPPCSRSCPRQANFWVSGYDMCTSGGFRYACSRVVVACGASDRAGRLHPTLARYCLHGLPALATTTTTAPTGTEYGTLVVGSGVSAADAVCASVRHARPAHHVHRPPPPALAALQPALYPDYSQVYKMMSDGKSGNYPYYKSYPDHVVVDITPIGDDPTLQDLDVDYDKIRPKRVKLLDLATNQITEITVSIVAVLIGSKPDLFFLQTNFNLNCIEKEQCEETVKKKLDDKQCFLRNHWANFKSALEQSIQSCKSRYLSYTEINGNNAKCDLAECNKTDRYEIIPTDDTCECEPSNPYSDGIGFGVDPEKPVDGRSNPLAIDKGTHELLNGPKGIYALGPVTGDNFIRFIPGGALAIVAHIHQTNKAAE